MYLAGNINVGKKSQAVAEFAIMGSLLLIVFAMIISYGQRYERTQEIKMQAFRKALQMSFVRNSPVTYTMRKDTRGLDMFAFGRGQSMPQMGYASVLWQKGNPGTMAEDGWTKGSYAFYEVNGRLIGKEEGYDFAQHTGVNSMPRVDKTYSINTPDGSLSEQKNAIPVSPGQVLTSKQRTNYYSENNRIENRDGISGAATQERAVLQDNIEMTVELNQDDTPVPPDINELDIEDKPLPVIRPYSPMPTMSQNLVPVKRQVVDMTGRIRNEITYCDVNDPNCGSSGSVEANRSWVTGD